MKRNYNLKQIVESVKGTFDCLILFGSYARGDNKEGSDVDVLQVTSRNSSHYRFEEINFSPYSKSFLMQLAKESSLFVLHIISEGRVIAGDYNLLNDLKKEFVFAKDYHKYKNDLIDASHLLCVDELEYTSNAKGYNLLACFLFRSLLYAISYEKNILSFSIHQLSLKLDDPEIEIIMALRKSEIGNYTLFNKLIKKLEFYSNANLCLPKFDYEEFYKAHIYTDSFPSRMISKYLRTDDEIY